MFTPTPLVLLAYAVFVVQAANYCVGRYVGMYSRCCVDVCMCKACMEGFMHISIIHAQDRFKSE